MGVAAVSLVSRDPREMKQGQHLVPNCRLQTGAGRQQEMDTWTRYVMTPRPILTRLG